MNTIKKLLVNLEKQGVSFYLDNGKLKSKAKKEAITQEIAETIKSNKVDIVAFLENETSFDGTVRGKVVPVEPEKRTLLSFAQQRLWFIDRLQGNSVEYNMPAAFNVDGQLDLVLVERVMQTIITRHEVLRTVYCDDENGAQQIIRNSVDFKLSQQDVSHLDTVSQQQAIAEGMQTILQAPFDLKQDLMVRAGYIATSDASGILLFNMHHIASDGWSMQVLVKEFVQLYQAFSQKQPNPLAPLTIQYGDYAHWQRDYLKGEVLEKQLNYWQQQLGEVSPVHNLPLDFKRPEVKQHQGAIVNGQLSAEVADKLTLLAKEQGLTPFMLLHGMLALLLSRHSNSQDIVIGTPLANRMQTELEPLIGFFVNTLVLRVNTAQQSLGAYFEHVKEVHLGAQSNQDVPFEQLVEVLKLQRSTAHTPLFQIMLTTQTDYGLTQDVSDSAWALNGAELSSLHADSVVSKFDLDINMSINQQGVSLNWTYDIGLFSHEHVSTLNTHLCRLLEGLATLDSKAITCTSLAALPMLGVQEQQLLVELNQSHAEHNNTASIQQLFESQADSAPDAIALTFQGQQMSYGELNKAANRVAHYLINEQQVTPDSLVGLCTSRSMEMVIGILGILKAGGAYVPLDPDYPSERLSYMVEDAKLGLILSHGAGNEVAKSLMTKGIGLEITELLAKQTASAEHNPEIAELTADNLAYVIYTSGSTGQPKGVQTPHKAVQRLITQPHFMPLNAQTVFLHSANIAFDAATLELWGPLLNGGRCVLYPNHFIDLAELNKVITAQQVNSMWLTAGLFSEWSQDCEAAESLRYVLAGGDVVHGADVMRVQQALPAVTVINGYGPTENTTFSCCYAIPELTSSEDIPIGKALKGDVALVLDSELNLVPYGSVGELCVGGDGLARGYLNQPQMTAERFIENPYFDANNPASSQRLYRTGDLVRYLPDGNLAFIGRVDDQIKIRGFRIELGEIAHQLNQQAGIDSSLVLAKEGPAGKYLVAYLKPINEVAQAEHAEFIEQTLCDLGASLPDYMVPSLAVVVQDWPLTANGKIDKKSLPAADTAQLQQEYIAAQNEAEQAVVTACADLLSLDVDTVSTKTNFFTLGGHSLLLMQLASQLRRQGFAVDAQALFSAKTLQEMAASLSVQQAQQVLSESLIPAGCDRLTPEMVPLVSLTNSQLDEIAEQVPGGAGNIKDIYPLAPLQEGVLFVHSMNEQNDPYVTSFMYEMKHKAGLDTLIDSLNFLLARHDVLRTAVLWRGRPQALQVVQKDVKLPVSWLEENAEQSAQQVIAELAQGPQWLDIERAPLLQLQVCQDTQTGYYYALLQSHHLIVDHVAMEVIQDELTIYAQGEADTLPEPASYRQFIADTLARVESLDVAEFFGEKLGHITEPTLPYGLSDTLGDGSDIKEYKVSLDSALSETIRAYAKTHQVSPAAIFHAAWALVVSACSGQQDVVFGTVLTGRMNGRGGVERLLGMLINTLPLSLRLGTQTADAFIAEVDSQLKALLPYEQISLAQAQKHSGLTSDVPLFSAMLNYRHSPKSTEETEENVADEDITVLTSQERTNYPFNLSVNDFGVAHAFGLDLQISDLVDVERVAGYVQSALQQLVQARQADTINNVSVLPQSEQQHLLVELNQTGMEYDNRACIQQLFESQADSAPDAIALTFQGRQMSYGELNKAANRVAHYLINEQQVTPDSLVGLCTSRSMEMVIGILGILKAGGAYVPLDPDYPSERLSYMVEDAGLGLILSHGAGNEVAQSLMAKGIGLEITELLAKQTAGAEHNPEIAELTADNLAYVIYTSGSTGQPKGVMLDHRGAVNLSHNQQAKFGTNAKSTVLHFASISFDAATWEWLMALIPGATLVIADHETRMDGGKLLDLLAAQGVTHATLPPALLNTLEYRDDLALKCLIVAGEACKADVVNRWSKRYQFFNAYGPSETSVCASVGQLNNGDQIHIGKALNNVQLLVLDQKQNLLPYGSAGELCVAGDGLARGYLNQPQMTAERFIENPYFDANNPASSQRLYRTGDLVRYLPDGNLAFIGRVDDQIKIRGFRIELGEIAHQLNQQAGIDSSLVLAKEGQTGKYLVAYLKPVSVIEQAGHAEFIEQTLCDLGASLPDYMVPSLAVVVQDWPLTANGKIDKKSLPQLDTILLQGDYVAATTETESVLCGIWQDLLKLPQVGIKDNFFSLGGDSILAIQMVGRAKLHGLHFNVKQVFATPSIQNLAKNLSLCTEIEAQQDEVSGEMPLLPIQKAFFEQARHYPHHYNQSILLTAPNDLFAGFVDIVSAIISRHDALRLRFSEQASFAPLTSELIQQTIEVHDFSELDMEAYTQTVERMCGEAQVQFDLSDGPVCRFIYFKAANNQQARIFMVAHHLIVDGVSWRILVQDLEQAINAYKKGQAIILSGKTSSYQAWGAALHTLAGSEQLDAQKQYWYEKLEKLTNTDVLVQPQEWDNIQFTLDKTQTIQLLGQCQTKYKTNVNELLLSALLIAYQQTMDQAILRIDMETHGRVEELFEHLDVTDTVGWFTNLYPLILESQETDVEKTVKHVKQALYQVPMSGLGFGVIKYLQQDSRLRQLDERSAQQAIVFNYLGKLDANSGQQGLLSLADESRGAESAKEELAQHNLMINGQTQNDCLSFDLTFAANIFDKAQIAALSKAFKAELERIVDLALTVPNLDTLTPSDFPAANLDQHQLDQLQQQQTDIERVYIATPMQQGMIYHDMLGSGESVYTTLTHFDLSGDIDEGAMKKAWQQVVNRHAILRTSFVAIEDVDIHQVVHHKAELKFTVIDWQDKPEHTVNLDLKALHLEVKSQGFDFEQAPLMQLLLVKLPEQQAQLIWAHHHVLTDGWCQATLFAEVIASYQALANNDVAQLGEVAEYENYIQWLYNQDQEMAKNFWHQELRDINSVTKLQLKSQTKQSAEYNEIKWLADDELTDQLQAYAQRNQVTSNTVLQLAWAYTLYRYSGQSDVCFGTTLSGRPAEIADVEKMIGLFINTVPVRVDLDLSQSIHKQLSQMHLSHGQREQFSYLPLPEILRQGNMSQGSELFDTLFVFENFPAELSDTAKAKQTQQTGLNVKGAASIEYTNYPIAMITGLQQQLSLKLSYHGHKYAKRDMEQLLAHYKMALYNLLQLDHHAAVGEVELLSTAEQYKALPAPQKLKNENLLPLHQQFEQFSVKNPDKIALVMEQTSLTYGQLNQYADTLASRLITKYNVTSGCFVGLCVERSVETVIGILAILKAGAAYVPLDPKSPASRLQYIVSDAKISVALTQACSKDALANTECHIIDINSNISGTPVCGSTQAVIDASIDRDAYIIYTSGSTGNPKGVVQTHDNMARLFSACERDFEFDENDTWCLFHSYAFDFSVWEIWGALAHGGKLLIPSYEQTRDTALFVELCQSQGLTILNQTPSAFSVFCDHVIQSNVALPQLRYIVFGGEALQKQHVQTWFESDQNTAAQLVNMYGITETTVHVTVANIVADDLDDLHIGKPLADQAIYLLDPDMNPVPFGVSGEMYVTGAGLAREYLYQPELTAERFLANPYSNGSGLEKMYKTGDLARYRADGQLEFLGRIDDQVQIRGFRIELDEVSHQLTTLKGVDSSVVIARDSHDTQVLTAYVKLSHEIVDKQEPELIAQLKQQALTVLPEYMIPSQFILIADWPMTVNGKIDKKALPEAGQLNESLQLIGPGTEVEHRLCAIWANILECDKSQLGINQSFFELGGHSLVLIKLVQQLQKTFEVEISIKELIEANQIIQQALLIEGKTLKKQFDEAEDAELEEVEF